MMFYFVLVIFLVNSCLSEETERVLNKETVDKTIIILRNSCQKKMQIETEILDGLRRGEFPDNPKLKCYIKCVMHTLRTMRNGVVDLKMVEKTISHFPERLERGILAAKNCIEKASGDDYCAAAYNFLKCTYEQFPEIFFFP